MAPDWPTGCCRILPGPLGSGHKASCVPGASRGPERPRYLAPGVKGQGRGWSLRVQMLLCCTFWANLYEASQRALSSLRGGRAGLRAPATRHTGQSRCLRLGDVTEPPVHTHPSPAPVPGPQRRRPSWTWEIRAAPSDQVSCSCWNDKANSVLHEISSHGLTAQMCSPPVTLP